MSKTDEQLKTLATEIKEETLEGANTAGRIGGIIEDIVDINKGKHAHQDILHHHSPWGIKQIREQIDRFITSDYDLITEIGIDTTFGENVGMYLWFDKTADYDLRVKLLDRLIYWHEHWKLEEGIVGFLTIQNLDTTPSLVSVRVCSQHQGWQAKIFLEHYLKYGGQKYYDYAKEYADYFMANNTKVDLTFNADPIMFRREDTVGSGTGDVSIKSFSAIDFLLTISEKESDSSYADVWYNTLAFVKDRMLVDDGGVNDGLYVLSEGSSSVLFHENMEMLDGLIDAYDRTGNEEIYDEAIRLVWQIYNLWGTAVVAGYDLGHSHIGVSGRRLPGFPYHLTDIQANSAIKYQLGIGFDNIFVWIYCLGFLNTAIPTASSCLMGLSTAPAAYSETIRSMFAGIGALGNYMERARCVAIGYNALGGTAISDNITGVGYAAGNNSTCSTCFGYMAGNASSTGVYFGSEAGRSSAGATCVGVGNRALMDNTGTQSCAIGQESGRRNQGARCIFMGYYTGVRLAAGTSGNDCIGIGYQALWYNAANNVVAIGHQAGMIDATHTANEAGTFMVEQRTLAGYNPLIKGYFATGGIVLGCPAAASKVADGSMVNSRFTVYLDEASDLLMIRGKKSDGTLWTAQLAIVDDI